MKFRFGVRNAAVDLRRASPVIQMIEQALEASGIDDAGVELVPLGSAREPVKTGVMASLVDGVADAALVEARLLPRFLPEKLEAVAFLRRENPRYALVTKEVLDLQSLLEGAELSACDEAAREQLARVRPDLHWTSESGDTPSRLHKVHLGTLDGIVEPAHHLRILGLADRAMSVLSVNVAVPAVGQGSWVIVGNLGSREFGAVFRTLDDEVTRVCFDIEQARFAADEDVVAVRARKEKKRARLDVITRGPDGTLSYSDESLGWDVLQARDERR